MDIHHIRYFLAVCETRNFTRAGERCNVTQPALSRAIQQLEDEVGGLLFRRERNLTHLTDLGALLRPRFQQILDEVTGVRQEASRFLCLENANLKVGVMCTIGPRRFTGLLTDFNRRQQGIQLQLVEGVPASLSQLLEAGEIDVAIMASSNAFPERFDVTPLYRERFVLAFPNGHRLARNDNVAISELDGENYLRRLNCEYRDHLAGLCNDRGVKLRISYASEREDWIQNMVSGGLGICFIPEFSAVIPGLQIRPVIDPEVWREVSLVVVAGRRFSPATSTFVNSVKAHSWPESGIDLSVRKTAA
ncbi:MAG: LysR family transcriptional regulator [Mesorhizobium sp.]|uniref:LysR family transcriptional regulator n=1 Tax=unclassified Mesorhizobium TaxID=325217 RepID=UPI000F75936E|nr:MULTISPECIES: LysR family transcriptional regulator [unclassified Mesorhizobium]AZO73863.1 LysR family transcriptional regulator [Mesorhizobium sp. M1D.F.Ca.ET.043.01.1.1]RWA95370.1 MAG: LysR family transcriptional regulator [Mesorhizobium sp.]RWE17963.1 MAG: LysR family transcriptional regulator [Mesorhizobium sp.]TJW91069.1 MAG: LysR family transcriptional regulator [Mesorhizobium sp.]